MGDDFLNMIEFNKINALREFFPEGISEERRDKILNKMADLLQKRLLLRVAPDLEDEQKKVLDELLKKNDPGQISVFMENHVLNLPDLLEEEIARLKDEIKVFLEK